MIQVLQNIVAYGMLGMLMEVIFTGIYSIVVHNDWRAKSTTYLWMAPIYGIGGFILELTNGILSGWPGPVASLVYVVLIYIMELSSGYVLLKLLGRKVWDYGASRWTPLGLINFRFAFYWYILAICFHYWHPWIVKSINILSRL